MNTKAWKDFSESNECAFDQIPGKDDNCVYYDAWGGVNSGNLKWMKENTLYYKLFNLNVWGVKK